MKRADLERHLRIYGCNLFREGGRHSVFLNKKNNKTSSVPRHREIDDFLIRKICKDLDIQNPWQNR